mgnify:FL=1
MFYFIFIVWICIVVEKELNNVCMVFIGGMAESISSLLINNPTQTRQHYSSIAHWHDCLREPLQRQNILLDKPLKEQNDHPTHKTNSFERLVFAHQYCIRH